MRGESIFLFTRDQHGYHGNRWSIKDFASPLLVMQVSCKFDAHWPVTTRGEGHQSYPVFSWWNVAWKPVFCISVNPCVFLDASIFSLTLGPRPTLSRNPRRNRAKIVEKLKNQTFKKSQIMPKVTLCVPDNICCSVIMWYHHCTCTTSTFFTPLFCTSQIYCYGHGKLLHDWDHAQLIYWMANF